MKRLLLTITSISLFLAACNTGQQSNGRADTLSAKLERNKAAAIRSQQAIAEKDVDLAFKDYAPGFVEYGPQGEALSDIDSLKRAYKNVVDAFDFKVENLRAIASGDTVAVLGTWTGTFKKAYMGTEPNGKSFNYEDVDIYVFNDEGKMTSHSSTQHSATVLYQLGLVKPVVK